MKEQPYTDLIMDLMAKGNARNHVIHACTHNGDFHADELLATAVLMNELPQYEFKVIRTRNPLVMKSCDIVYDVGNGKYDHHSIHKAYYPNGIPMAACGKILNDVITNQDLLEGLRTRLFYAVEAHDNGTDIPPYIQPSKLSFVSVFSLNWLEDYREDAITANFHVALEMVRKIYERTTLLVAADIKADEYLDTKSERLKDGEFLLLDRMCPIYSYSRRHPELIGYIYPRQSGWTVRLIQQNKHHEFRGSFPLTWCGKCGVDLQIASGFKSAVFCHAAGFMVVFNTREDAIASIEFVTKQQTQQKEDQNA